MCELTVLWLSVTAAVSRTRIRLVTSLLLSLEISPGLLQLHISPQHLLLRHLPLS